MTMQLCAEENSVLGFLHEVFKSIATDDDLGKLRAKAWDRFLELGLPTRRDEVFRYVPLRSLYNHSFSPATAANVLPADIEAHVLPECANALIVFVNGYFQPSLSRLGGLPSKIVILPIDEALRSFSGFFMNNWVKSLREEADPFAALNAAMHPKGAFLYVPPKIVVEKPIQILHIMASESPGIMMPRLHVFAGIQAQLQLVSTHAALTKASYFYNAVVDIHLEEDVNLKYYQDITNQVEDSWHFHAYRANIKRNSVFKTIDITDGSKAVRADYKASLLGEGAEALLNNLWMLSGKREAHSHVLMDHQAPNCHSMQLFKGALSEFSRSSFEGKILVRQAAQKTDAFQLNNNLLLSERAHADSKPNLEIFADDVKASHGATFGQLNDEHLFYMKSRGFTSEEAKNLLVYGYCKEILEMIPMTSLQERLQERARRFLTQG